MKLSEKTKGILFIICSATCFACMTMSVRLAGDLPTMEKALFRNLIAGIVVAIPFMRGHEKVSFPAGSFKYVLARAICGTIGLCLNFYAVDKLNLADSNILNKLSPLFAVLFSAVILREKVKPVQIGLILLAILGAALVIKPGGTAVPAVPAICGFISGVAAGMAYACLRKARLAGASGPLIVLFFSAFTVVVVLPFVFANFVMPTLRQFLFLLLCGFFGAGGQLFITAAYSHAPAREISIYDYSQVLVAALLGYFVFGQIPDLLSFAGYIIIIGSAFLNFRYSKKQA